MMMKVTISYKTSPLEMQVDLDQEALRLSDDELALFLDQAKDLLQFHILGLQHSIQES